MDVFVSRDLDSQFSSREVAAVKEWMDDSNLTLHSMRDHPGHGVGMTGAMWGTNLTRKVSPFKGKKVSARSVWKYTWKKMLKDKKIHARRYRWGPDQELLYT